MTKTQDRAAEMVKTVATRVTPPLSEAEQDLALRHVEKGADPVHAVESVIDGRVALASRAVRERDGDPYPPVESLLDEGDRRARATAKYEEEFGDGSVPTPDAAREQAGIQAAQAEIERLHKENKELAERLASSTDAADATTGADVERLRQERADLEAEVTRLRESAAAASGEATPKSEATEAPQTGREQTGSLSGTHAKITGDDKGKGGK